MWFLFAKNKQTNRRTWLIFCSRRALRTTISVLGWFIFTIFSPHFWFSFVLSKHYPRMQTLNRNGPIILTFIGAYPYRDLTIRQNAIVRHQESCNAQANCWRGRWLAAAGAVDCDRVCILYEWRGRDSLSLPFRFFTFQMNNINNK